MKPAMKTGLLVLLAMAALSAGVVVQREWQSAPTGGVVDLAVAFPDLNGRPHLMDEWKGKVLVVNFWATWCPPCVEEMPEFSRLQTELGASGVQFVGILIDDEAEAARDFLKSYSVSYPILNGAVGGREWSAKLGDSVEVLPYSVVFDANGRLVHKEVGRFTREEVLEQVRPLLK
jgi:thiol-disulfide isomerase/thioredoxin